MKYFLIFSMAILFSCKGSTGGSSGGTATPQGISLTLNTPATTPNYSSAPKFMAAGINSGDTINIYSDSACSTLVGSAVAASSSVLITTTLPSSGIYSFYLKSTNASSTSACSAKLASYNYLGTAPVVSVSWNANREHAVNMAGGGYRVYYATSSGVNTSTATFVDVPYVSGPTAPTSTTFSNFLAGTYYFKVVAYSALNPVGGTTGSVSSPSAEFSVSLP